VTVAVRDARMGRRKVKRGSYIVLGTNDALVANDVDRTDAIRQAIEALNPGFELLTIYCGRDVDSAAGQLLRDTIAGDLDGVDIELVDGGQAHYDFLITAE
jgi:dihydroxyacetone kinase-like predicted kinase